MRARNVLQLMQGGCVALIVVSSACFATPSVQALPKTGSCPSGYSTSGIIAAQALILDSQF
jgi:hypothetical protein